MTKVPQGKKVLVAMSGGVDSSVAAALLLEQGYQVVGCFMRLGSNDTVQQDDQTLDCTTGSASASAHTRISHQGCCSLNDAGDARLVCAILDIPLYVLNFKRDFARIIDYFVEEYNDGRTPNPCIRCNTWLKFGKLADYARSIDADYIATGHYARVQHTPGPGSAPGTQLLRGKDHKKDQSYVLFTTPCDLLEHMLLPIGEYEKHQVRTIAREWNLPVFDKPDSQEICFVPDNDYFALIKKHTPQKVTAGAILDSDGQIIGQHDGHQRFTIGQRRGVSVSLGHPIYVVDKDPQANTITVATKDKGFCCTLHANQTNWLIDPPTDAPLVCQVKIRSNSSPVAASVVASGPDTLTVQFARRQQAVSPGQAVVCYRDDQLIGGGWIVSAT